MKNKLHMLIAILILSAILPGCGQKPVEPAFNAELLLQGIQEESDLSTFKATYNGVAAAMNEKKPDKLDYYVSYEACVEAGFDFSEVTVSTDDKAKKITITLPEIKIIDTYLTSEKLDFIYYNDKARDISNLPKTRELCLADVREECKKQGEILSLARENAVNVITALTKPMIDQMNSDYTLVVK